MSWINVSIAKKLLAEDLRYFLELGNVGEGENNEDVENEVSEAGNM